MEKDAVIVKKPAMENQQPSTSMSIELKMKADNIADYRLGTEDLDLLILHLEGEELTDEQKTIVNHLFTQVQTFKDAFQQNNWSFEGKRVSIPCFFILVDLTYCYDSTIIQMYRISEMMKDIRNGTMTGVSERAKSLRWNSLEIQLKNTRNGIITMTNEILSFCKALFGPFQNDDSEIVGEYHLE